jgi:hypothetical protein
MHNHLPPLCVRRGGQEEERLQTHMKKFKRKRGAQPGNQNARKHNYYAANLDPQSRSDVKKAASLDGIEEEIVLLRLLVAKAARSGDTKSIKPLIKAMTVLEKLLETKRKIDDNRQERVMQAVLYLGRILYDGWVNSGYPVAADIKNFYESKRIDPVVAKGVGATNDNLVSASLA